MDMYEIIPPYGVLKDVSAGDPWQPESAARYNAVNELLRQSFRERAEYPEFPVSDPAVVDVLNTSQSLLPRGSAVQIDTGAASEHTSVLPESDLYVCGRAVEDQEKVWGVALEDIPPGDGGPVQLYGVVALKDVQGQNPAHGPAGFILDARSKYVYAGLDGKFHFGNRGRAEVLWYDWGNDLTVVMLNALSFRYAGMFAVLDNGNGTFTVTGGTTDLYNASDLEDTVLPIDRNGTLVCLTAVLENTAWKLGVEITASRDGANLCIPGEKIVMPLARYNGVDNSGHCNDLVQLHHGGMVSFREIYYIEQ